MHRRPLVVVGALTSLTLCAAGLLACGDDTAVAPPDAGADASLESDAAGFETGAFDATQLPDGSTGAGEAGTPPPARILLSYGTTAQSELDVFGLRSGTVDGRLAVAGAAGTPLATPSSPWLLEPGAELVARLDPIQPWIVRSSWSVALGDATDAGPGAGTSDPDAIVLGAGTQAYVLRGNRNVIAVIDTSLDVDAGAPSSTIDLSSQLQPAGDGTVGMVAGVFDAVSNVAYVLLGQANRSLVGPDGRTLGCTGNHPTVVAIDTTTNAVVAPPGGDAGAAGYALGGYAPGPSSMAFDTGNHRLLVLESGCVPIAGDGGVGAVTRRGVEAVSLDDGSVTQLLDLSAQSLPSFAASPAAIFYVDVHHVVLQLGGAAFVWDPASPSLGSAIANAPTAFALDGQGNLVGVSPGVTVDGGVGGWSVVSVNPGDGGATTLGQDPFSLQGGTVGGVALWPAP